MIEIEKYARAAASTARTPPNSPARQAAIEAENTARVAAEQFVKGLEAERDLAAHCLTRDGWEYVPDSIGGPCWKPPVNKAAADPRARLAEIEAQELDKRRHDITLNASQLRHALDFAAPDFDKDDAQRMAEVSIGWREAGEVLDDDGHPDPAGYVAWMTEYPEEGCTPLLESWESTTVPAQAAPDGWRLVPVEPTIAMCIAGDSPRMLVDDCTPTPAIYRAMIAAAPEHKA